MLVKLGTMTGINSELPVLEYFWWSIKF